MMASPAVRDRTTTAAIAAATQAIRTVSTTCAPSLTSGDGIVDRWGCVVFTFL